MLVSPLLRFFVLAYAISWAGFAAVILLKLNEGWLSAATFGPSIAAWIVGRGEGFSLERPWRCAAMAAAFGSALITLAFAVVPVLIAATDPARLNWAVFASVSVFNWSTLLGGPLGEEPGWRGYALPRLRSRFGMWGASAILGLLWTGWHLPLLALQGWTSVPLHAYALILTGETVLMAITMRISGNIIVPVAMHAIFNTTSKWMNGLAGSSDIRPVPIEWVLALSWVPLALLASRAVPGNILKHGSK